MPPTSGIQVRGDLSDLLFYRQHDEAPDEFTLGLAPHRDVTDFDHLALAGGARLLEKMIKASLQLNGIEHDDCRAESPPAGAKNGSDIESGVFTILSDEDLSKVEIGKFACKSKDGEGTVSFFFDGGTQFAFQAPHLELRWDRAAGVDLQIKTSSATAGQFRDMISSGQPTGVLIEFDEVVRLAEISRRQSSRRVPFELRLFAGDQDGNSSYDDFRETLADESAKEATFGSAGNPFGTLVLVPEDEAFEIRLKVNGSVVTVPLNAIFIAAPQYTVTQRIREAIVARFKGRAMPNQVRVSAYGDWTTTDNGSRSLLTALWEIAEFGRDPARRKKGVFRLKGARGFLRGNAAKFVANVAEPMNALFGSIEDAKVVKGNVEPKCKGYSRREYSPNHYEYFCFIDLAMGYASPENRAEWAADLGRLQKAKFERRLIIADIARCIPDLRPSNHDYRALFEHYVHLWLSSQLSGVAADVRKNIRDSETVQNLESVFDKQNNWKEIQPNWDGDDWSLDSGDKAGLQVKLTFTLGSTKIKIDVKKNGKSVTTQDLYTNLHLEIPAEPSAEVRSGDPAIDGQKFGLWDYLYTFFRDCTVVIVSANVLRAHGHLISHRLSWEKTAQDCVAALQYFPLGKIGQFGSLIIRVGLVGAVRTYQVRSSNEPGRTLYFDPIGKADKDNPDAFYRDVSESGHVVGANATFCGSILAQIIRYVKKVGYLSLAEDRFDDEIAGGIHQAIANCQELYDWGYGKRDDQSADWNLFCQPEGKGRLDYDPYLILSKRRKGSSPDTDSPTSKRFSGKLIGTTPIIVNPRWRIIDEVARAGLYRIACKIAVHGLDKALNAIDDRKELSPLTLLGGDRYSGDLKWPKIIAPVIRFGEFVTTDRDEAECLRNIDSILRADLQSKKPISIAVFGPPGAGKSFAVTELMNSIFKEPKVETCNLSQLSDPSDLGSVLLRFNDEKSGNKRKVLFVDEFDSSLDGRALGWLRYFLALMQDGTFKHSKEVLHIDKCILVFAGAIFQRFSDFAGQSTASSDEKRLEFVQAKGPDFVSRLAGHIDLIGVNARDEDDNGFVLRRALLLRSIVKRRGLTGKTKTTMIAPALIESMLRVSSYNHGARSMEIVLKTCIGEGGKLALPTLPQLRMHVDADQLVDLYNSAQRDPTIFITRNGGLIVDPGYFN